MAVYSYQYTLYNCSPTALKVNSKYWAGRQRTAFGSCPVGSLLPGNATLANSQAYLVRIPAGSMIVDGQLYWEGPTSGGGNGLGASTQVVVGDSFNCARFLSLTNTSGNSEAIYASCGKFNVLDGNAIPMNAAYLNVEYTGIGYECTCDTDIIMTLVNGGATIQGHVRLVVTYVTE